MRRRLSALWSTVSGADARAARAVLASQLQRNAAPLPAPAKDSAFAHGTWSMIGGDGMGWPAKEFYKVRGLAWHEGRLYASLTGPTTEGPRGEVWAWDGKAWEAQPGGWNPTESFVEHLFSHCGFLYAAERSGMWQLARDRWQRVAESFTVPGRCGPYAFAAWQGRPAVAFWGDPSILVLRGERWERLPAPDAGWGEDARTIYCLNEYAGALYAGTGTGKFSGPGAAIWRFNGRHWEKIAGGGLRGSWIQPGIPFVLSLNVYGGFLVATVSRPRSTHAQASNVWAFDGEMWHPVGTSKVPELMARSLIMNDSAVYGGRLVVATGDGSQQTAQLWELEADQRWRAVGGDQFDAKEAGIPGGYWVYKLCVAEGALFAGTAGHEGAARVFRFGR